MRLGTVKVIKVNLRNAGILRARYFIECPNKQFSADPEQGFIEGSGSFDISIKFSPKINGNFNGMIRILAKSGDSLDMDPIFIDIQGIGSYPELVVLTKVLDFGTALLGVRNILSFLVENKGSAEANIIFDCHHKGISLESGSNLTIPPNSKQPLQVIYQPSVVEVLDAKMLLKSSDSRGDFFLIRLKGIVGVPKLTLDPPNIFENLDFGVCQNLIVHEKLFKMTNDGNIPLNYTGKLKLNFVKAIAYSSSKNNFEYEAISVNPLRASLAVGESVIVKVIFVPSTISHYSFQYDVNFDFKNLSIEIKGTGGQSILNIETKKLDFGICRLDRIFRKNLTLFNSGNLSANFILRPEPKNKDWSIYSHEVASLSQITTDEKKLKIKVSEKPSDYEEEITKYWNSLVSDAGLCVPQSPIRCDPGSKADAVINYNPKTKNPFNLKFRVFAENGYYEECDFSGFAETPKICIYSSISAKDAQGSWLIAGSHLSHNEKGEIDLGVRAVNSSSITIIQLVNEGNFGCDFLIQPIILKEFSVYPMRGFVASGSTIPLKIYFTPGSEERFQTTFKLLWEGAPLKIGLTGFGGLGKLFLLFSDEADEISKSLDFGDVPFQTNQERRWYFLFYVGLFIIPAWSPFLFLQMLIMTNIIFPRLANHFYGKMENLSRFEKN